MSVMFHTKSVEDEVLPYPGWLGKGLNHSSMLRSRMSTLPVEVALSFVLLGIFVGTVATSGPTLMPLRVKLKTKPRTQERGSAGQTCSHAAPRGRRAALPLLGDAAGRFAALLASSAPLSDS